MSDVRVWMDGQLLNGADARVSVFDHGLLYGDGVFEGVRLFDGAVFRLEDHLDRLERSCRAILLEPPIARQDLVQALLATVRDSGLKDAHIRIIITRGFGEPGVDPLRSDGPSLLIMVYPFPPLLGSDPIRLVTSPIVRKAPRTVGAHVKSLNYLDSVLAKQYATAAGATDAVMLDFTGAVAECSTTNIFAIRAGGLATPTTRSALPGITRRTVLEIAAESGVDAVETEIWPMELYVADGMFLTGSASGVVPVREIDGRPLATVENPLFDQIRTEYLRRTRDERFLTPVPDLESSRDR